MAGAKRSLRIALAGNPNSGKTSLFNALTGARHKVGNYPGVTVEKKEGSLKRNGRVYHFIDLPGIYSLTAYSQDEVVARDFLLEEKPDLVVDVLDSTNLERHLYLCLQFLELGLPVIGALNMSDEAESKGLRIDAGVLSSLLGLPLVKTIGSRGVGLDALLDTIDSVADSGYGKAIDADTPLSQRLPSETSAPVPMASDKELGKAAANCSIVNGALDYGTEIESRLVPLRQLIFSDKDFSARYPARWLAVKLLEKDADADTRLSDHRRADEVRHVASEAITWLETHFGRDAEIVVSEQRYGYIRGALAEAVSRVRIDDFSTTEAIDRVIMNRFLALPIFVLVLWGVFQTTFLLGEYPILWLEMFFGKFAGLVSGFLPEGWIRSLIVDGIISGVGGVFSFVPLIVILFFLLSVLEDTGYMSRAAFASDKLLHAFGLHGQSIFPMILGFGCSVPAMMAARALKNRRDRIVTILVIPMMSCGAKLPVYALLSAAFFPNNRASAVMAVYGIGVVLSLLSALVLRRTVLKGEATPFVMELPPYRMPTLNGLLWHVWDKTLQYLKKAGTVILGASVLIWIMVNFPVYKPAVDNISSANSDNAAFAASSAETNVNAALALEYSAAGRIGKFVEPVFRPLGFDWRVSVAMLTGFAAKEVVVSTLGVLYAAGEDADERRLSDALRSDPGFDALTAFILMLFVLVIPPCFATLATIKAELGWAWLGFSFVSLFSLGWILGFIIRVVGTLVGVSA